MATVYLAHDVKHDRKVALKILRAELGAGGMATVYLAADLEHDRKVAIKVLKPELAARRISYHDGRHMVAASVTTSPAFAVTDRTELFPDEYVFAPGPHANYDVAPDGRRFLMVKSVEAPELLVVYGWLSELRARTRIVGTP